MNNLEQIVCQYYKDKDGNPMSYHIRRKHQISPKNYQIQLDGIPDEYRGVDVIEPIGLYRVYNADEITEDSYWVRDDGNVFFHESRACQNVMLDYYSIGLPVVGAGRIYTLLDEEGNVIETLEDILEKGKTVIEALKTMSDVIVAINDLKTSAYEGIKVVNTLDSTIDKGYELLTKLNAVEYVQKTDFNNTVKKINSDIQSNDSKIKNISKQIEERKITHVNNFGAKGDGRTDDYESIQSAIDYCAQNNLTTLYFSDNIYYTTKSINTKGIKIIGYGQPYIPFLDWGYTRDNIDKYSYYKDKCRGTIITSDKDINIFSSGLNACNIGIFGNRLSKNQNGISQTQGNQPINLNNCMIVGMGKDAINAPYGLISPYIKNSDLLQNGRHGIFIDKEIGNYTGETNHVIIQNCLIERNESHGIYGNIMGRGFTVENCIMEFNGEPSDDKRKKPKSIDDVIFNVYLNIYKNGGMGVGKITFKGNYSEETCGMLYINAKNPCGTIDIQDNFWTPYSQDIYSCGIALGGWINGVNISSNNFYTTKDYILLLDNHNIMGLTTDMEYTGIIGNNDGATKESQYDGNDHYYYNIKSNGYKKMYNFNAGSIKAKSFSASDGVTYYFLNDKKFTGDNHLEGVDIGIDGYYCNWTGYALKIGGNYVGIIRGWSIPNKCLIIKGDRQIDIGDGSFSIEKVGGFQTKNGKGDDRKIVIDWDDSLFVSPR
ncbi:hypothetical protein MCG45_16580 [Clostridium perfringens]|uniref:glycosyl hydrolase family 28-related protein n=1 Tax=Clostridium perfringens TaxID=1502 RepID=UPI001F06CBE3|nr:glycosyl hydrolase family 28-related protein [Clostridium perfringens]MCH1964448.1 hypothetical protein [Clostridium perfringens]